LFVLASRNPERYPLKSIRKFSFERNNRFLYFILADFYLRIIVIAFFTKWGKKTYRPIYIALSLELELELELDLELKLKLELARVNATCIVVLVLRYLIHFILSKPVEYTTIPAARARAIIVEARRSAKAYESI